MSKINGAERTSNHSAMRVLADSELSAVTGGLTIQKLVDAPSSGGGGGDGGGGGPTPFSAWNQLQKDYGYIR